MIASPAFKKISILTAVYRIHDQSVFLLPFFMHIENKTHPSANFHRIKNRKNCFERRLGLRAAAGNGARIEAKVEHRRINTPACSFKIFTREFMAF